MPYRAEICRADPFGSAFLRTCGKPLETRNFTSNVMRAFSGNIGPALVFAAPPRYLNA